eukprot:TRINITY_DN11614_c0_g1_i1.p1 TRINITY_DN11614_c0_g1~~TRINITY_DN11614_c0_g1_i1.p1  ORF type:complete len:313 (-),score=65.81 TRINITY_DN11614_c0_g1_i1:84-1022(-)
MARSMAILGLLAMQALSTEAAIRVAVSGAGGQTGGHAFRKMLAQSTVFEPVGLVRTEESRQALLADTGAPESAVIVVDVARRDSAGGPSSHAGLMAALAGCAALLIGSSAKVKPTGVTNPDTGRPNMGFPDGQLHEVDWLGEKAQIDVAKEAGVRHVVICSSMGGTDPNHMLNNFGRNADGKTGGNMLRWKRKAEKYLIDSGLDYTILHPGGLLNEPGGFRDLLVGVDDSLLAGSNRSIPREDVAEMMLQSLQHEVYKNRSLDVVAGPAAESCVAVDYGKLLDSLKGANCDYSLGLIPDAAAEQLEAEALAS